MHLMWRIPSEQGQDQCLAVLSMTRPPHPPHPVVFRLRPRSLPMAKPVSKAYLRTCNYSSFNKALLQLRPRDGEAHGSRWRRPTWHDSCRRSKHPSVCQAHHIG